MDAITEERCRMAAVLALRYCYHPDTAQRIGEAMAHGDLPRVLILAGQAVEAGCARGSLAWRAAAAVVADVSGRRAAWLAEEEALVRGRSDRR